jgi:hypothetical protein
LIYDLSGGDDCNTDHYAVVAKPREKLAVSTQAAQKLDEERFTQRKLNAGGLDGVNRTYL